MVSGSDNMPRLLVLIRLLLAVTALVSQLTLGALALPDRQDEGLLTQLHALRVLCVNGPAEHRVAGSHRHHHPHQAALPPSVALALPAVILMPSTVLPPRMLPLVAEPVLLPPARGPPFRSSAAFLATGPPILF